MRLDFAKSFSANSETARCDVLSLGEETGKGGCKKNHGKHLEAAGGFYLTGS
jgi:hypothetical protein